MDLSKIAGNPWVWGVGVVLGVLVLASRSGGSEPSGPVMNPNIMLGLNEISAANNAASMDFSARMAAIASDTAKSNAATNLARDVKVIDAIVNIDGIFSTLEAARIESAAGVTKSRIEASTALALDREANETRRDMIYVAGNTSNFATQLAADIERQKTSAALTAQTQANKINGDNAFWEGVGNFILGATKMIIPFF